MPQAKSRLLKVEHNARVRAATAGISFVRQVAPEVTGELKSKLAVELGRGGGVRMVSGAEHSIYVWLGTMYQAANPGFTMGFEVAKKEYNRQLSRISRELK